MATGPMSMFASNGSPTRTLANSALSASTSSSCRSLVTMTRVSAEHTWPVSSVADSARDAAAVPMS